MLLLNKEDIQKVFTMKDAIEADKKAFALVADKKIDSPLRTSILEKKHDGNFLFMPSYSAEDNCAAVKIINIFPHNIDNGLNSCPAQILLMDGATGYVTALLDGIYVTQLRTGASSGAAFDLLGRKDAKIGGMIGTGGQAAAQLEAMLAVRRLEEVRVFDLNVERCRSFCEAQNEALAAYGARIVAVDSADRAVEEADLFVTVTPSPVPVFDGTKVKKGATVSCVGTFEPNKHEMDPRILPRASKIICDDVETALSETGDLLIPISEGVIFEDEITCSIGDILNGRCKGRENDEEIIVYETVGFAAMDLIAANAIYQKAKEAGMGMIWD